MIDISKLDKAEVLAALYNHSKPQGVGRIFAIPGNMGTEEARGLLAGGSDFDYVKGRVLKVDLSREIFDPWLYDRDNGAGAAARALSGLEAGRAWHPTGGNER